MTVRHPPASRGPSRVERAASFRELLRGTLQPGPAAGHAAIQQPVLPLASGFPDLDDIFGQEAEVMT